MPTKSLNQDLNSAKVAKKDEFYTQYVDIQKEVEAYLEFDVPDRAKPGRVIQLTAENLQTFARATLMLLEAIPKLRKQGNNDLANDMLDIFFVDPNVNPRNNPSLSSTPENERKVKRIVIEPPKSEPS